NLRKLLRSDPRGRWDRTAQRQEPVCSLAGRPSCGTPYPGWMAWRRARRAEVVAARESRPRPECRTTCFEEVGLPPRPTARGQLARSAAGDPLPGDGHAYNKVGEVETYGGPLPGLEG